MAAKENQSVKTPSTKEKRLKPHSSYVTNDTNDKKTSEIHFTFYYLLVLSSQLSLFSATNILIYSTLNANLKSFKI